MKNYFKNPWAKGGEYYPEEVLKNEFKILDSLDKILSSAVAASTTPNSAASSLANNEKYIDGLQKFQDQDRTFFWSKNGELAGSTSKPSQKIDTVVKWDKLFKDKKINARIALLELAELNKDTIITNDNISKIADAYENWPTEFKAIFQQLPAGGDNTTYTCNIFVGECLFLSGVKILANKKYYSASAIFSGQHPSLKEIYPKITKGADNKWDTSDDICMIKAGDVWAKGGSHLEIVTSIQAKDGIFFPFCSRGAGRTSGQGEEKCGSSWFGTDRYVNLKAFKFFRIK